MIRRLFRWAIRAGAVVGGAAVVRRLLQRHEEPSPVATAPPYAAPPPRPTPEPAPTVTPARPAAEKAAPKKAAPKKAAPDQATTRADAGKAAARPAAAPTSERPAWVEPQAGACPSTHPVKAKQSSGIFHLPGMQNYDRTVPDRCYVDAAAAEADGLRAAKR